MRWINCNEEKAIPVDAVVRRIGYTDTMTADNFKDSLKKRLINALDYEWLDESPSPSIDELAQKLREANPWPNDSNDMYQRHISWKLCVDKLLELLNQKEVK